MSDYTSENTHILEICEQAGGNVRMLLMHEADNPEIHPHEYVIGSYFQVHERQAPGMYDAYEWDWGHYFPDVVSATEYWCREVLGQKPIELGCKFGTLAAHVVRSGEEFAEIAVDLVRSDGGEVQVALIGTYETPWNGAPDERMNTCIHTYVWDGEEEDYTGEFFTKPDGECVYH